MRGGAVIVGPALAAVCGVLTAYVTLQPLLQEQKDEREGGFAKAHPDEKLQQDSAISQAIFSDIKEARKEVETKIDQGGFAWGIRQALSGKKSDVQSETSEASPSTIVTDEKRT